MMYRGSWNDGQSARRQEVRVRLVGRELVLTGADDRPLLSLPVSGLRLTEEVYADRPLRFSHQRYPDARLTVDDHALLESLRPVVPGLRRRYLAGRGTWARMLLWGGALAATVAGLVVAVPLAAQPLAHAVPMQWETRFGESVMAGMLSGERQCQSPAGTAALNALVERLNAAAEHPYPFTVRVVDDDTVNAFAAPGGHIVILDGLLQKAGSPQVLAAVLAHEMAHVIERHPTQAIIRRTGYQLVLTGLTGDLSSALGLVAESGELLLSLAHSRGDESAADDRAIEILQAAGVDSTGLSAFFAHLATQQDAPPDMLRLLSTHPLHDERIAQARRRERPGQPAMTAEEWSALQAICHE